MAQLEELELEECGATDALMLRLLKQATSLKRLQLRGEECVLLLRDSLVPCVLSVWLGGACV
jgi:hypothetical protein